MKVLRQGWPRAPVASATGGLGRGWWSQSRMVISGRVGLVTVENGGDGIVELGLEHRIESFAVFAFFDPFIDPLADELVRGFKLPHVGWSGVEVGAFGGATILAGLDVAQCGQPSG